MKDEVSIHQDGIVLEAYAINSTQLLMWSDAIIDGIGSRRACSVALSDHRC